MNKNIVIKAAVASALCALASTASAQWYFGGQVGQARGGPEAGHISESLVRDLGFFSASTSTDRSSTSWRAFAGYEVLPWLAVEGAYVDLGKSRWASTVTPPGTIGASLRSDAWTLGLAAHYPFTQMLSVYGRVSAAWVETKGSFSSSGFATLRNSSRRDRNTVPAYAAGLEVSIMPRLAARLEYERMSRISSDELGGKFDADLWSVGLRYSF
ncbi:MAG: outer membrane beta-barrel protein [Pseudomonadota bacterium]|nr:outer membrane beta-barrel protein [Pseudomonadota bacterium]